MTPLERVQMRIGFLQRAVSELTEEADAAMELEELLRKVGSVVAEARQNRREGGHHLAVYGAIGKVLIDMPEWDEYEQALAERKT